MPKRFMPISVTFFRLQNFVSHLWYQAETLPNRLRLVGLVVFLINPTSDALLVQVDFQTFDERMKWAQLCS
jgi:hypothetical protein